MDILAMARAILPENSPWMAKVEQAQQLAAAFQPSKSGVQQLMAQYGKTNADLQKALEALQVPLVANTINRFAPGMVQDLQAMGEDLMSTKGTEAPPQTTASHVSDLQKRLSALK